MKKINKKISIKMLNYLHSALKVNQKEKKDPLIGEYFKALAYYIIDRQPMFGRSYDHLSEIKDTKNIEYNVYWDLLYIEIRSKELKMKKNIDVNN